MIIVVVCHWVDVFPNNKGGRCPFLQGQIDSRLCEVGSLIGHCTTFFYQLCPSWPQTISFIIIGSMFFASITCSDRCPVWLEKSILTVVCSSQLSAKALEETHFMSPWWHSRFIIYIAIYCPRKVHLQGTFNQLINRSWRTAAVGNHTTPEAYQGILSTSSWEPGILDSSR